MEQQQLVNYSSRVVGGVRCPPFTADKQHLVLVSGGTRFDLLGPKTVEVAGINQLQLPSTLVET